MLRARLLAGVAIAFLVACSGRSSSTGFMPQSYSLRPLSATDNVGVDFVVTLPLRNEDSLARFLDEVSDPSSPTYHRFLSREQFAAQYAPAERDLHAVELELQREGFTTQRDLLGVSASGNATRVQRYFGVRLAQATWPLETGTVTQMATRGRLHLSSLLRSVHASVIGLQNFPPMQKFLRTAEAPSAVEPHNGSGKYGPYLTPDLKQAYRWPSFNDVNGSGATMAIVIDLPVKASDVDKYAQQAGLPSFRLTQIAVGNGGKWSAKGSNESTLDVEQSAGMAPAANVIVYHTGQLTVNKVYNAYSVAIKNKKVDVVNSSFGVCEAEFDSSSGIHVLNQFDQLFAAGSSMGVTFVAASDDQAAFACPNSQSTALNKKGVSWPAMDPYVLAVGGTNLTTSFVKNSNQSTYVKETAFAEPLGGGAYWGSGGGYSQLAKRPSYQNGFTGKGGRGVPDMALMMGGEGFSGQAPCQAIKCNADDSSDWLRLGGHWYVAIGTSASSPEIVGLVALRVQKTHSSQGDIHKWLYANGKGKMWRKAIKGNNGYKTTSGAWDPVLGLGTPFGNTFVGTSSVAGTPGSSTNP